MHGKITTVIGALAICVSTALEIEYNEDSISGTLSRPVTYLHKE